MFKIQIGTPIKRESMEYGGKTVKIWVDFSSKRFSNKLEALKFWFGSECTKWSDKVILEQYKHIPFNHNSKIMKIVKEK